MACTCGGGPLAERIHKLREAGRPGSRSRTRTGRVVGIHEHYSDKGFARIELEDERSLGAKSRAATAKVDAPSDYVKRFDVEIAKGAIPAGLALGHRVRVHTIVEKA